MPLDACAESPGLGGLPISETGVHGRHEGSSSGTFPVNVSTLTGEDSEVPSRRPAPNGKRLQGRREQACEGRGASETEVVKRTWLWLSGPARCPRLARRTPRPSVLAAPLVRCPSSCECQSQLDHPAAAQRQHIHHADEQTYVFVIDEQESLSFVHCQIRCAMHVLTS